jgi:predicted amidophosphoribosyltransferase
MNPLRCPDCGAKLGAFFYADACPHCKQELKHNTRPLTPSRSKDLSKAQLWPARIFFRVMRFVES